MGGMVWEGGGGAGGGAGGVGCGVSRFVFCCDRF